MWCPFWNLNDTPAIHTRGLTCPRTLSISGFGFRASKVVLLVIVVDAAQDVQNPDPASTLLC